MLVIKVKSRYKVWSKSKNWCSVPKRVLRTGVTRASETKTTAILLKLTIIPEVTIGDYTTTHFYMCGSAQTAKKHKDKPGMEDLIPTGYGL